ARAPEPPAGLRVTPRSEGRFDVAVVAYDYFGEFAMLCGLLAVHGLDITSGHVHTLPPRAPAAARPRGRRPAGSSPRTIVDVFRVRPRREPPHEDALERELIALAALVAEG